MPLLTGLHHVSVPARDPLASSDWYVQVFGFATTLIEEHETAVVGVLLQHPCGAHSCGAWPSLWSCSADTRCSA